MTTTENTFMEEVGTYTTYKIATFIDKNWFLVLIPIGLVGNTLSFVVMIKANNRKMSTCIYMAAISINDNLMMCLLVHNLLVVVFKLSDGWHPMECKVVDFFGLYALQNSTFQILAMTVDKYIAIKWPHKASTYSTPGRAKVISVSLSVFALLYNIPHFVLSRVIGGQCFAYAVDSPITKVYSWFSFVLNAVIPFTMLIHMNYVIVKTVRRSRKMFRANDATTGAIEQGNTAKQKIMKSAENQLTIMLLLVTTLFLILLCPTYVRFIYLSFATQDTPYEYANSMFFFQFSFKLYATNSGIIFLLYCMSGRKFRNDLKEILCCHRTSNDSSKRGTKRSHSQATDTSTI